MTTAERTPWAAKAASLYDDAYAERYRSHDDDLADSVAYRLFVSWLEGICARLTPPFAALDLGCGTGRYFWALRGAGSLVGLDASDAMLAKARHPLHEDRVTVGAVTLVRGDLLAHDFAAGQFDLVYSIGVLAEHVPLQPALIARVRRWLRPGGRFAFSTVHPLSESIPRTWPRRAGALVARLLPAPLARGIRERLLAGGLYADEERVRELLADGFAIESLERVESEAHLHCLCVARTVSA
jgi:SAM-dependent methyltransferase